MKILGKDKLIRFVQKHADARNALTAWAAETEAAAWHTPQDIKNTFGSADFLAGNRVIFNIRGNRYRLVVKAVYVAGRILVEWVGTHAEYDKQTF